MSQEAGANGGSESSGDEANRRRENRASVTLIVDYAGTSELADDYTSNLSMGGTFVHTDREFPSGTEVKLVLACPGLIDPIEIKGVARWTRPARDTSPAGVGIEFTDYGEDVRQRLRGVIESIRNREPTVIGDLIRILIVEDNHHVSRLIRDGLSLSRRKLGENLAIEFSEFSDGRAALDAVEKEHFDLAIVDIYMPVLDGVAFTERIRSHPKHRSMPIIAVSAGDDDARDRVMAAGANHFIGKPLRLASILATVRGVLDARR